MANIYFKPAPPRVYQRSTLDRWLPGLILTLSMATLGLTSYTWVKMYHPSLLAKVFPSSQNTELSSDAPHWRTPVLKFGKMKYAILGIKSTKRNTKQVLIKNMITGNISIFKTGDHIFNGPVVLHKVSSSIVAMDYKNLRKTVHFQK